MVNPREFMHREHRQNRTVTREVLEAGRTVEGRVEEDMVRIYVSSGKIAVVTYGIALSGREEFETGTLQPGDEKTIGPNASYVIEATNDKERAIYLRSFEPTID